MKQHRILKDFKGSQTGHDFHQFIAGTEAGLSDSLAAAAVKEGWAEAINSTEPETVVTLVDETVEEPSVEDRETKVELPPETKPAKKPEKKANGK